MSDNNRSISLRFLAQPTDVNFGGKVHGGAAMKWLDQAGYVCATAWSGSYCVTAFVGDINFQQPVHVGDLLRVDAKIIHTGNSSMHIAVTLSAGKPTEGNFRRAVRCIMVFIAVDEQGKPTPVTPWQPREDADLRLQEYALRILELRKTNAEIMDRLNGQ